MTIQLEDNSPLIPAAQALQTAQNRIDSLTSQVQALTAQVQKLTVTPRDQKIANLFTIGLSWGFLQIPYKFGAEYENDQAFDCSAFCQKVFATQGVTLYRTSRGQATQGTLVTKENIQAGDELFFDTNGDGVINHCGIADGKGGMMHTNTPGKFIRIESLAGYWDSKFVTARRQF